MITQCLNPNCLQVNLKATKLCEECNSKLLLVDRYRAISLLGQGGFGRTCLAIDEFKPSKPRCVIKQFLPEVSSPWITGNSKGDRVLRGGSWLHLPGSCRSAQRIKSDPKSKSDAFGFRIAASI